MAFGGGSATWQISAHCLFYFILMSISQPETVQLSRSPINPGGGGGSNQLAAMRLEPTASRITTWKLSVQALRTTRPPGSHVVSSCSCRQGRSNDMRFYLFWPNLTLRSRDSRSNFGLDFSGSKHHSMNISMRLNERRTMTFPFLL